VLIALWPAVHCALDAYALIYGAYFSFIRAPRVNSKGFNTSAAFGFTTTLLDLIKRESPRTSPWCSTRRHPPSATRPSRL
jgi:5'-3' exonuclease